MGYYGSPQHERAEDARAIRRVTRKLVAEVDALPIEARLLRAATRIIYKTKDDALARRDWRYRTQRTNLVSFTGG